MKTTKTQFLGKRLLIPLLLVEIAAVGVGLSSPVHSTSSTALQSNECAAKLPPISREVAKPNLLAVDCPRCTRRERSCVWKPSGGYDCRWICRPVPCEPSAPSTAPAPAS